MKLTKKQRVLKLAKMVIHPTDVLLGLCGVVMQVFDGPSAFVINLKKEERGLRAITGAVRKGLQKKVKDHNEKVGDVASKRTNLRTLSAVFNRGVGAYKTNPQSVRPSVKSPEQWAYSRVNSFLYVLRNGKFRSGKHDTDLLPKGHPMSSKRGEDMSNDDLFEEMEERHIVDIKKQMTPTS